MSDHYLMLSEHPDDNGRVDILVNKTKYNYLNLGGINSEEVIDSLHAFLCKYNIWQPTDNVVHVKSPLHFIPKDSTYHNISFVLIFYKMACKSREHKEKVASSNAILENKQTDEKSIQLNVQHLTNQNINHDINSVKNDTGTTTFISPNNNTTKCETINKQEGSEQTNSVSSLLEQQKDVSFRKVNEMPNNNTKSLQTCNQVLDYTEINKILEDTESDNDDIIKIEDSDKKQRKKKIVNVHKKENEKNKDDKNDRKGRKKMNIGKKKYKVERKMDKKSRVDNEAGDLSRSTEDGSNSENFNELLSQHDNGSTSEPSDVVESLSISENDQISDVKSGSELEKSESISNEEQTKVKLVTRKEEPIKSNSKKVIVKEYHSGKKSLQKRHR
ncbi:MAG: hypothetical protein QXW79_00130 [Thermoplasmata archaeon]